MAERVPFRGGLTCSCVVESLPWVEKDLARLGLPSPVRIFQLGYRTDVSASAGTHAKGGCVDLDGTPTAAEIDVWRLWGWTMQARFLSGVTPHCHGWPYKCTHLSAAAQQQEADWNRKDAGLQGGAQVQGRWPVKPWDVALEERKALLEQPQLGVPLMANAEPIRITYHDDQPLTPNQVGYVHINSDKHVSVVVGESEGIDCTAIVEFDGLKEGEQVRIFWRKAWKKTNTADKIIRDDLAAPAVPYDGDTWSGQVRYADSLPKADTGWTACLRLCYLTDSSTAKVVRRQFRGWKIP